MEMAFLEAKKAFEIEEIPIGAVVVKDDKVIGFGYNRRESTNEISKHAEVIALEDAARTLGTWKLDNCVMYVTLEPCLMCYGAIKQSRIKKVYAGQQGNPNKNFAYSNEISDGKLVSFAIKSYEAQELLKKFFEKKRR